MSKLHWRSHYFDKMRQGSNSELFIELIETWTDEVPNVYMWALSMKFFVDRLVTRGFLSPKEKGEVQRFLDQYEIVLFDDEEK